MRFRILHLLLVPMLLPGISGCRLQSPATDVGGCRNGLRDSGIPEVRQSPRIDGQQGDTAWDEAICLNDFTPMAGKDGTLVNTPNRAKAWLCRDADFLYFALLAEHDSPENARSRISGHDAPVWEDDDFEVFLDPAGDGQQYYHILANTVGAVYDHFVDAKKHDMASWDSGAVSMGSRTETAYYIELAVPLLAMNMTENRLPRLGMALGRGIPYCRDFKKVLGSFHQPSTWTYFPLEKKCQVAVEDFSYSIYEGESPFRLQLRNLRDVPLELSGTFNGKPIQLCLEGKARGVLNISTFLTAGQPIRNELVLRNPDGIEVLRWYRVMTPRELLSVIPLSDLLYRGEEVRLAVTINEEADAGLLVIARDLDDKVLQQITVQPVARQFQVSLPFPAVSGSISCHYKKASKSFVIQTIPSPWAE